MPEILYINLDHAFVVTSDDAIVPVTNFFDYWGEECDPGDAECVVAGPYDNQWLSFEIDEVYGYQQ